MRRTASHADDAFASRFPRRRWRSPRSRGPRPVRAPVMPLADVTTGMTGTGWTVAQGTHAGFPSTSRCSASPRTRIAARARPDHRGGRRARRSTQAGGIWAGMSGSPVYVGGELIGAVSYGFSVGPSMIGGVTPAEDMIDLLGHPVARAHRGPAAPRSVRLSVGSSRARSPSRSGVSLEQASDAHAASRPALDVGLSAAGLKMLANELQEPPERRSHSVRRHLADRLPTAVGDPLEDGRELRGVVSYGDVTAAAVGTATYVCDGQALAFGHPFLFGGPVVRRRECRGRVRDRAGRGLRLVQVRRDRRDVRHRRPGSPRRAPRRPRRGAGRDSDPDDRQRAGAQPPPGRPDRGRRERLGGLPHLREPDQQHGVDVRRVGNG